MFDKHDRFVFFLKMAMYIGRNMLEYYAYDKNCAIRFNKSYLHTIYAFVSNISTLPTKPQDSKLMP